jgi:hypothetical protein
MIQISGYKALTIVTPEPRGSGGKILNHDFRVIADNLEDLVFTNGTKGFTNRITGVSTYLEDSNHNIQIVGYHLATLGCINATVVGSGINVWNAGQIRSKPVSLTTPSNNDLLTFDENNWTPSGISFNYLKEIFEDKTPKLGGDLDVNNYVITGTSGIFFSNSSGILLLGDLTAISQYEAAINNNWGNFSLIEYIQNRNINLQYIQTDGGITPNIVAIRNAIVGGYGNQILWDRLAFPLYVGYDANIMYSQNLNFNYNAIIGGYNNEIYTNKSVLGLGGWNLQSTNSSCILGGQDNYLEDSSKTIMLATDNARSSGTNNIVLTGSHPISNITRSQVHGIKNIAGAYGGLQEIEFYYWGDFPSQSGGIPDMYGNKPYELPEKRFLQLGGTTQNKINCYELYCVISASGSDGSIHVAAWAPIYFKSLREDQFVTIWGMSKWVTRSFMAQDDDYYEFGGDPNAQNYVTNSFKESGIYPTPGADNVYWYPSKYNTGLSGLLTIYQANDEEIFDSYYYDPGEYLVLTSRGLHGNYPMAREYSANLIIHFRLYEKNTTGFRATVWGKGFEVKTMEYFPIYG